MSFRLLYRFVVQQCIAVSVCPAMFAALLLIAYPLRYALAATVDKLWLPVICVAGVFWGYRIPRFADRSLELARWVWVIPLCVFCRMLYDVAARSGLEYALAAFFYPASEDNDGLAQIVATLPTASAISYSIGAAIAFARRADVRAARANQGTTGTS